MHMHKRARLAARPTQVAGRSHGGRGERAGHHGRYIIIMISISIIIISISSSTLLLLLLSLLLLLLLLLLVLLCTYSIVHIIYTDTIV